MKYDITKIELFDYSAFYGESTPPKTKESFIEAAEFCSHTTTPEVVFHLQNGEKKLKITFNEAQFENGANTVEIEKE